MIENLLLGFEAAITMTNLLFIAAGITLGIVIGAIPGLGSVTALAILVPVTFYMSPVTAIAFLVGVNKGGTSGGAIPAILLNSPGTPEAAASARSLCCSSVKGFLGNSETSDPLGLGGGRRQVAPALAAGIRTCEARSSTRSSLAMRATTAAAAITESGSVSPSIKLPA